MSKELVATVVANPHITEVHFTAEGHHYFNVHEHKGEKYGQVFNDTIINNKTGKKEQRIAPNLKTKVVKTVGREEILKADGAALAADSGAGSKKK